MNYFNKFVAGIFLVFLMTDYVYAQNWPPGIDSLYIVPDEPIEADEILLVIHATIHHSPCHLIHDSVEVEILENMISIETNYFSGMLTAGCLSIDTISLGQLSVGHYDLTAFFDHEVFTDEDSLSFFVGTPSNIAANQPSAMKLNLFPNPNNGEELVLEYHSDTMVTNAQMSIYDNTGRIILESKLTEQNRHVISLPSLSQGLYYIKINHEDQVLSKKFIVH